MSINKTKTKLRDKISHHNWMGGISFDITNPINKLRIAASSCFFGEPTYYHKSKNKQYSRSQYRTLNISYLREVLDAIDPQDWRSKSPEELMTSAIDNALEFNPRETLELAAQLRNEYHIRITPQVILVRAAMHSKVKGTNLVRVYAKRIIKRVDELSTGLSYYIHVNGGRNKVPNSLKRAWRDAFERFDEYQLAKYRMESREVKTVDVANLCYGINRSLEGKDYWDPKTRHMHDRTPVSKLLRNDLTVGESTWEGLISSNGSNKETWERVINEIFVPEDSNGTKHINNYMAILRNIRNFIEKDVSKECLDKIIYALKDPQAVSRSKQLPFRFYSAYTHVKKVTDNPKILDAIEDALMQSVSNIPKFNGKVMSLCDNSGSAQGVTTSSMGTMKISTIANLTGIITGMSSEEGYIGIFGDKLETLPVRKNSSVFDQLDQCEKKSRSIGLKTENGIWLFFDKAIKEKEHWDHIFVYSDMQAGHGGLYGINPSKYCNYIYPNTRNYIDVAKLINQYRTLVNPNVMVYLVQVAGYQDTLIPEYYNKTFILGGWSDSVLKFAHEMGNQFQ